MNYKQLSFTSRLGLGASREINTAEVPPDANCPRMFTPESVLAWFQATGMQFKEVEQMWVVGIDASMHARFCDMVYQGTTDYSITSPKDVLRAAIRESVVAIFVAHNHPSGRVRPSPSDVDSTKLIQIAGWIVGIDVVDCFILAGEAWFSMKEHGYMEERPDLETMMKRLGG